MSCSCDRNCKKICARKLIKRFCYCLVCYDKYRYVSSAMSEPNTIHTCSFVPLTPEGQHIFWLNSLSALKKLFTQEHHIQPMKMSFSYVTQKKGDIYRLLNSKYSILDWIGHEKIQPLKIFKPQNRNWCEKATLQRFPVHVTVNIC